jgi:hypothetical protein
VVGRTAKSPRRGSERPWHVTAYDYRTAAKRHDLVEATGRTEEALGDLAELLRGWIVERTRDDRPT